MIGLGCPGGAKPASATRSIRAARRPVRAAPSAERRIRSAASAAAASAGVGAVEKMYERARLTMQVDDVAGCRHESAERAQCLRQRADPHDRSPVHAVPVPASHPPAPSRRGGRREVGAEDGVGLIEDEEGVVAPAEGDELVEGGDVPIHGEDGVGDDDGRRAWACGAVRPAAPPGGPCRGGGRRRALSGRAGSRR